MRSQLDARTPAADVTAARIEPAPPPIAPERDAFAPRATIDDDPQPVLPTAPPQLPRLAAPRVLPAIAPAADSRVTAIVTGTHATAIVNSAGGSKLVSIGDPLDGSSIIEISNDTVVLTNGKRLMLEPAATP